MELQQLRYVVAVASTLNFTRAAEQCFVAQSALSQQIKALERELGVALFARTSRRVELTAAGAAFLPAARDCLAAADRAVADAADAVGEIRGPLRIGAIPTVTAVDVPELLGTFHRSYPQVGIALEVAASNVLQDRLGTAELDAAFLGLPGSATPRFAHRELDRHALTLVVPARHRLAGRRRLTLADLVDEPFADFPAGTPGRAQSDEAFRQAGLTRGVAFESTQPEILLGLVEHGLAVAFLAPGIVPYVDALVRVPVVGGPERAEYVAWNGLNPTPAARALLALLPGWPAPG